MDKTENVRLSVGLNNELGVIIAKNKKIWRSRDQLISKLLAHSKKTGFKF